MIDVTYAGAFLGGVLTLLSPCSALLLPAFFAYAFQRPGQLLLRTGVFYVGMASVLVPLGMGIAAASRLVYGHRSTVIAVAGGVIILLGLLQLAGRGFTLLPASRLPQRLTGDTAGSTFALGAVHGLAGFCAGPLLGAVLTMAAASDGPAAGAALLAVYAAGMALPLFGLALVWDRVGPRLRGRLRGRTLRLGGWRVHSTGLISGTLFITIGVTFIATEGTVSMSGLYGQGSTDLAYRLQERVVALTSAVPDAVFVAAAVVGAGALWARARTSRLRDGGPRADEAASAESRSEQVT
jgi:cytochrome c biogenesis protein CcdA